MDNQYAKVRPQLTMDLIDGGTRYFPLGYVKLKDVQILIETIMKNEIVFDSSIINITVVSSSELVVNEESDESQYCSTFDLKSPKELYQGKITECPFLDAVIFRAISDICLKHNLINKLKETKSILQQFIKEQTSHDNINDYQTLLETLMRWID